MSGFLALEDGTVFRGQSVGAEGYAFGEAVFTTAMTGYQEVVTDPSYAEQLVCFALARGLGIEGQQRASRMGGPPRGAGSLRPGAPDQ